jgi:hypothetical protein
MGEAIRGRRGPLLLVGAAALGLAVGACAPDPGGGLPRGNPRHDTALPRSNTGYIFGDEGLNLFGLFGGGAKERQDQGSGIAVNSFLWRASLDTIAFMPLSSADPFGGVIITDWYSPPESPSERFKINVFILDRQLRSDGIRAAVFRQMLQANGQWAEAPVDAKTAGDLENAILNRARQLRLNQPS